MHSWVNEIDGLRLDLFLVKHVPDCGRRLAAALCDDGIVRVNGAAKRPGTVLRMGDRIELEQIPKRGAVRPELVEAAGGALQFIRIAYEDDELVVVEKPRMMHTVVQRSDDPITVADCIAAYAPVCIEASQNPAEGGLVQRLDFETSGLLMAAKNGAAWEKLHESMLAGEVTKSYLALVGGVFNEQDRDVAYDLRPAQGAKRMVVYAPLSAESEYNVRVSAVRAVPGEPPSTLVRVVGQRFRRHQVRAYLAGVGNSLVGDKLYGSELSLPDGSDGFLLHAEQLEFTHPVTGERIVVTSESELLNKLL